jgi:superfamily II DNA or RNA helicase
VADDGSAFHGLALQRSLWPHQQRALDAFDAARATGSNTYLVIPPGGGKTMVGLEAARRLARPTLVLCPNTAIQAQWIAQWASAFTPAGAIEATASRDLPTPLTVLTYQAVCTIDNGAAAGDRHLPAERLLEILHPNGRDLLSRLSAGGPWTLVLDECHHLLEIWGRLLAVIVGRLAGAHVIGLTATPPHMMTTDQKALHDELFGAIDLEVSAPALVRDGRLAPYQELAYVTTPTPPEADYIHGQAVRFAELRAGLLDPGFAATPFLDWLQRRIVERHEEAAGAQVSWERFERDEPALAGAALRLHSDGMLALPDGARLREQHRHPPTAEDWVALIGDYCRRCLLASGDPRDERAYEAIRVALPSIGYRLTRTGPRAAESPVDRVLARSASKAGACVEILHAESAELGDHLRALILTDFVEAGGTVPADLSGVMTEGSGGALLALEMLLADQATATLGPVLMTGQRVACGPGTARRLADWLNAAAPGLGVTVRAGEGQHAAAGQVTDIAGGPGWEPRRYVPLVTRFFAEGQCRCLVGTRALLGEGWDAPAVNVVIDLTAATTPTSVVQARGRALRLDDGWPEKVADNWAVVCLTGDHPKGSADYDRFVRKHDRYFALSGTGDIISGVAHVDPGLSPFGPPDLATLTELDARMLIRASERAAVRDLWNIGEPYADEPVATVTVSARHPLGLSRQYVTGRMTGHEQPGAAARLPRAIAGFFRIAGSADTAPSSGSLEDMAMATADALHEAGLASRDGAAVQLEPLPSGGYRARLRDVPAAEAAMFATALDEVLAPLAQPRYLLPRLFLPRPAGRRAAIALALRRLTGRRVPATVVYHAVPSALGVNRKLAQAFARAWNARVSPGELLYAGSPEGAGILAAQRGDDPFAVTTQIRTLWR